LRTHSKVQRRFERMAASRRAAIIQRKNNVALLRHEFVPQKIGTTPGISNYLGVRPSVGVNQHGILFCASKFGGLMMLALSCTPSRDFTVTNSIGERW